MSEQKIVIVTGANAGLGFHTTHKLAQKGYTVVMGCRSLDKAEAARAELQAKVPDATLDVLPLDLSRSDSIAAFAAAFAERYGTLDMLVNNAGIVGVPLTYNDDGYELHLATNYLGPFALTGLLLPCFNPEVPGHIVNIGSLSHRIAKLPLDDINWKGEQPEYDPMKAYARSKLAGQSYNQELARRLAANGSKVISVGAHPGFAATEITIKTGYSKPAVGVRKWIKDFMESYVPSPEQACEPALMAALGESVENGDYYGPSGFMEIRGAPAKAKINKKALDPVLARQLWSMTEEMTGVSYLSRV